MNSQILGKIKSKDYCQIYINAHGNFPVTRASKTMDGHIYRKARVNSYIGTVPDNTILVTATPPKHSFMVDENEHIIKELMNNILVDKIDYLLKHKVICNLYDEYIYKLLKTLQIYQPNDHFINLEVLFDNKKINNVFSINDNLIDYYLPNKRRYYGIDSVYKSYCDTRYNNHDQEIYFNPYDTNYIPYSLSGLITSIRKSLDSNKFMIIYNFMCQPQPEPKYTNSKLESLSENLYLNGLSKANQYTRLYREVFYKTYLTRNYTSSLNDVFIDKNPISINYNSNVFLKYICEN